MKKLLMIAYHFPPLLGSSGIQRTLRFVQHLPSMGWQPLVLSADPRAYEHVSNDLLGEIPAGTVVRRPFALDTARHIQIKGRYAGWMARPDRWVSWRFPAVRAGLKMIKEFRPDAIWSTFPIATAHLIASSLQAKSGLPWIADFRDPMAQEGYPSDRRTWQSYLDIERAAAAQARYCTFTTPSAAKVYQHRYPVAAERMAVIENGYDEESFAAVEIQNNIANDDPSRARPMVLLHSGIVYPEERDPTQFFHALGQLKQQGSLGAEDIQVRFRASVHDDLLRQLAKAHDIQDLIELCPPIAYKEALSEMMAVDALLLMQGSNCNAQIPAKTYEYLRAGKPILGLTDPNGDTADVLRRAGLDDMARLDSVDEIAKALMKVVRNLRASNVTLPSLGIVQQSSRLGRSRELANLLERATTPSTR